MIYQRKNLERTIGWQERLMFEAAKEKTSKKKGCERYHHQSRGGLP
jgi:hypothetical protein